MATNTVKKQQEKVATATGQTVTVACKIPQGLKLQLQHVIKVPEQGSKEHRMVDQNVFGGRAYYVHGPAYPVAAPKGFPKPPMIEGGYALTRGIPLKFWEEWLEQNKLAPYVVAPDGAEHGFIFAYPDIESTAEAAREQEKMLCGLEPISTDTDANGRLTDPRLPKPMNDSVAKIGYEPHGQGA
jgi:hypothetical protein